MPELSGKNTKYMRQLVGAFFAYMALDNLVRMLWANRAVDGVDRLTAEGYPWWRKGIVGFAMGLLAGLLGIGGGSVAVPAQQALLKMPLRSSIATSAAAILCVGWVGAVLKNAGLGENGRWQDSLLLAAALTPTAMIGSYFGGHLTHKLPLNWVRAVFILLMALSAGNCLNLL
jgi:hypothetical protein